MRFWSMCCLGLVAACTRNEQQPGSAAKPSAASIAFSPASSARTPPSEARCLWPLLSLPPPPAARALRCPRDDLLRPPVLPHGRVIFADTPGRPVVEAELAIEPAEQTRGLMFRQELGTESGMLFWGERETVRHFWMHNTCIPLDMLFLAKDGLIVGILEQVPVLNDESRSVPCPSAHVLEVNAGWARAHGVRPGQRAVIER